MLIISIEHDDPQTDDVTILLKQLDGDNKCPHLDNVNSSRNKRMDTSTCVSEGMNQSEMMRSTS